MLYRITLIVLVSFFSSSVLAGGAGDYPAPGKSYEARFGDTAFLLRFDADGKRMRFEDIGEKPVDTVAQTVDYTAVKIRPNVYMVYWTEADGTTVVHVEDFEKRTVHTNITTPDLQFLNMTGSFTEVEPR